jgi:Mor family transcriptional regulator
MADIYEEIEKEDLTEDLDMIANVCGLEVVRNLMRHYPGLSFYIPKVARLDTFVSRYLKTNKKLGFKKLANELCVSESYLRRIIKGINANKRTSSQRS